MKTFRVSLTLLFFGLTLRAQDPQPPQLLPPSTAYATQARSPQELDQLLAPIALYPDALIALILPATTVPTDIVLAARHLRENPGDRSQIEHRAWDESVKSLTNYPEVIQWMDENLHWTQQLGEAFAAQPADVMQAVQRLRAKARAAGTLVDTPQQQVISEPQVIRIVPAQPDVIYVPHYEPEVVFVDRPIYYGRPFLSFGTGVAVGSWLAFDCDWHRSSIWVGNRHRRWTGHDWHRPVVPIAPAHHYTRSHEVRQWRPPAAHVRTSVTVMHRSRPEVVRPSSFALASARVNSSYRDPGAASRRGGNNAPNVVPTLPHNLTPGFRAQSPNTSSAPRQSTPRTVPTPSNVTQQNTVTPRNTVTQQNTVANRFAQPAAPVTTAPNVDDSGSSRRGRDWSREGNSSSRPEGGSDRLRGDDSRSRSFRSTAQPATPNVPAAPNVAPSLPIQSSRPSQMMGPTPQRSFSRPSAPSAPESAPPLRMQGRSAPPPVAQPAGPPSAPAAAPVVAAPQAAPARQNGQSGGESRGHRGSFRRDN